MLTDVVLGDTQGGMIATLPADHEIKCVVLNAHDDLVYQRANDLLAGDRRRPRAIPGAFDVRPKGQQAIPLGSIQRDGRASGERIPLGFNCASYLQVLIPAPFEFTGDQAVVRIDRVVLSLRAGHFVARLLECEFDLPKFLASLGLLLG